MSSTQGFLWERGGASSLLRTSPDSFSQRFSVVATGDGQTCRRLSPPSMLVDSFGDDDIASLGDPCADASPASFWPSELSCAAKGAMNE